MLNPILKEIYLLPGETERDMYNRVARAIMPDNPDLYSNMMSTGRFLPNTPTLVNAGSSKHGGLSACYALKPRDSLESIMAIAQDQAMIHSMFGGTGFNFSSIRPKGFRIKGTGGSACGPIKVLKYYDETADMISQGGWRQGANMGILNYNHPDIVEFINLKGINDRINHFNTSVGLWPKFFRALNTDDEITLEFGSETTGTISATGLLEMSAQMAFQSGSPGLIFFDNINKHNLTPNLGDIDTTNPCVIGSTLVSTIHGPVPIKDLVGQEVQVYCYDESTHQTVVSTARNIRKTRENARIIHIHHNTGTLTCTPDHKIFTIHHGYVPAIDIKYPDLLITLHNGYAVNGFVTIKEGTELTEDVYDLEVDTYHNFFANNILIHNCGEQPLYPNESCNLGSLNLGAYVQDESFVYEDFKDDVRSAVHFLDSVIDKNNYPTPDIKAATQFTRKVGLGIMGWHDCLLKCGISWCTDDALSLIDDIGSILNIAAINASVELAEQTEVFPAWSGSVWDTDYSKGVRNATLTTIAPTGTLSFIAECSSGIEPIYDWDVERTTERGKVIQTNALKSRAEELNLLDETNFNISWEWQLKHVAAWQHWIHNAVSKTVNLSEESTVETIKEVYLKAHELGCKGITVYRNNSRQEQVLKALSSKTKQPAPVTLINSRPATIYPTNTGCGKMYVILGNVDGNLNDCFVISNGGCEANNEATGRNISFEFQSKLNPDDIARKLRKVQCISSSRNKSAAGKSCADIIGRCIQQEYATLTGGVPLDRGEKPTCPNCNTILEFGSGCHGGECPSCGWSGCN